MSGINSDLLNRRLRYLRESATSFIFDNPNTTMWEEFDIVARENAAMQQVLIGPVEEERFDLNLSRTDLAKLIESSMHREASLFSEPASKKRKSQLDHIGDFMQLHKAQRINPPCDNPNMTVQSTPGTSSQSTPGTSSQSDPPPSTSATFAYVHWARVRVREEGKGALCCQHHAATFQTEAAPTQGLLPRH